MPDASGIGRLELAEGAFYRLAAPLDAGQVRRRLRTGTWLVFRGTLSGVHHFRTTATHADPWMDEIPLRPADLAFPERVPDGGTPPHEDVFDTMARDRADLAVEDFHVQVFRGRSPAAAPRNT